MEANLEYGILICGGRNLALSATTSPHFRQPGFSGLFDRTVLGFLNPCQAVARIVNMPV
jgi:hypothetical protein